MVFQNDILAGSSGGTGTSTPVYKIDQSIRFNSPDEHYMYSPTPSSSKSFTTTATISMWIKLGDVGRHYLAGAYYGSNSRYDFFQIDANNKLKGQGRSGGAKTATGNGETKWITAQVFRDPLAWYHLIFVYDTTNAIESERFRLYVNGARVTEFDTPPSYGENEKVYWFSKSSYTTLGAYFNNTGYADYFYWDGYMAEMHGVDGTALDQHSFGEYNSSGIWIPKQYTGSHGTDGFYIKGENANTLGTNSASNGNNFTLNEIFAHDQVLDSPTNNFSTLNPLIPGLSLTTVTYSEGNLKATFSNNDATESTIGIPSSGKWYFEGYVIGTTFLRDDVQTAIGLRPEGFSHQRDDVNETGFAYGQNGKKIEGDGSSGTSSSYGASYSADDIIGVAVDMDASPATLIFYKNNASQGTAFTFTDKTIFRFGSVAQRNSSGWILNFGQDSTFAGENVNANDYSNYDGTSDGNGVGSFFYTPPSGHLALCTKNLGES